MQVVRHFVLALAVALAGVVVFGRPPLPQDPAYHLMADQRALLGIPNCLNVLSNLFFAVAGLMGLAAIFCRRAERPTPFADPWERWPYAALFAGTALTAFGSAYYHLAPDNARLVWDRLPMTLGFMGLLTAVLAERVSLPVGRRLFCPLLLFGAGSVAYWYWSELRGGGDLRPYVLVQFGALFLAVLLLLLYPARRPGAAYLFAGLAAYAAAKWFELADRRIFALGQIVSGHTLKHVAAAGGVACVATMLRARMRRGGAAVPPDRCEQQTGRADGPGRVGG
jgi:hypothetical protein